MAFGTELVLPAGGDNALSGHYNGGMALGVVATLDTAVVKQSAIYAIELSSYVWGTPNAGNVGVRIFVNGATVASALNPNSGGPIGVNQIVPLQAGDVITIGAVGTSNYGNPYLGPLIWTATPLLPRPVPPLSMGGAETEIVPRNEWVTMPYSLTAPSPVYAMCEFKATTSTNTTSRITVNGTPVILPGSGNQNISVPIKVNAGDVVGLMLNSISFTTNDRRLLNWSVSLT